MLYPFQNLHTPYTIPSAEPEPEPEPFSRRLSRRLISSQRMVQNLMIPTNPQPTLTTTQRTSTVTTQLQTSLSDRRTNLLKLLKESFHNESPAEDLQFNEMFSESPAPNPWVIDTAEFEIVPAVPGEYTPAEEVSEDNREGNNIDTNVPVPVQFSPVPAVPDVTTVPNDRLARQPKNTMDLTYQVENTLDEENYVSQTSKVKGNCLERCVHGFCLQEDDFTMFGVCVDECKSLCL